jgi:hypothetical protein
MTSSFPCRASVLLPVFLFLTIASAQTRGVSEYQSGGYTFKLINNGQNGQAYQGMKPVGTIYTVNGDQQIIPIVPEPEATALKAAFAEWKAAGRKGSTEAARIPVAFQPDGSAIVPLQDGTVVTFAPTFIEVNQPNALGALSIPGQPPINNVKFMLEGPAFGKVLFGSHTGIFFNGKEIKDYVGFGNGGRKSAKSMAYYLKPLLEGPVTDAANFAAADPNKPADAPDHNAQIQAIIKRL